MLLSLAMRFEALPPPNPPGVKRGLCLAVNITSVGQVRQILRRSGSPEPELQG